MIVAVTGPSKLSHEQELVVAAHMDDLVDEADTWRSGCAQGVDTVVAHQAVMSGVNVELFVPLALHNYQLVTELTGRATIIRCPSGPSYKGPYRTRNEMMLNGADHLVAFLKRTTFYRSGEWMTVNIAHYQGVPVAMFAI